MSDYKAFEEWFAVKLSSEGAEFWPGRLKFDPSDGMSLETTNFCQFEPTGFFDASHSNDSLFEGDVILGYLDYQRPTTLLKPFISKVHSGKLGYLTPHIRNRYTVTINGILKNIHLEDIDDRLFLAVGGKSQALHGWLVPDRFKRTYGATTEKITIEFEEYSRNEIPLSDEITLSITNIISGPSDWESMSISGKTYFMLKFSKPMALYPALDIYNNFQNFLTFLIGGRLNRDSIKLSTTKTVNWNDEDKKIEAELFVSSNRKTKDKLEVPALRFLTQHQSNISLKSIFLKTQNINKDTRYFMNLITSVEMRDDDTSIINKYINLIGCLEKFDKNKFGGRKTLLPRLERLVKLYHNDGFRGNLDLVKVKKYRNYQPHGEGASLTVDIIKEMYWFSNYLCALGRYHILKDLGFSADSISNAFCRKMNIYGSFSILSSEL